MTQFLATVTEDVKPNRLLSLSGGNGMMQLSVTEPGGTPDFKSTGALTEGQEVTVTIKNDPVWEIEAGEELSAGAFVEVGAEGVVIASGGTGIGFVAEAAEEGELAKVIRQSSGTPGPRGPKGEKGEKGDKGNKGDKGDPGDTHFTKAQADALLALLDEGE